MRLLTRGLIAVMLAGVGAVGQEGRATSAEGLAVSEGRKISIEFTITLPDHTVAASNVGEKPLTYIHGRHQILPSLEEALTGMKAGDQKTVPLTAEQAFGPYDEKKKMTLPRDVLPDNVKVGDTLRSPHGPPVTVLALEGNSAVVDFNHPLAGKDLVMEVKVLQVEPEALNFSEPRAEPVR